MAHPGARSPEEARHDLADADHFRRAATPGYPWWYPPVTSALTAGTFGASAVGRAVDDGVSWSGTGAYAVAVVLGLISVTLIGHTEGRRGVIASPRRSRPAIRTASVFGACLCMASLAAIPGGFPGFLATGGVALGAANWWSLTGEQRAKAKS